MLNVNYHYIDDDDDDATDVCCPTRFCVSGAPIQMNESMNRCQQAYKYESHSPITTLNVKLQLKSDEQVFYPFQ